MTEGWERERESQTEVKILCNVLKTENSSNCNGSCVWLLLIKFSMRKVLYLLLAVQKCNASRIRKRQTHTHKQRPSKCSQHIYDLYTTC